MSASLGVDFEGQMELIWHVHDVYAYAFMCAYITACVCVYVCVYMYMFCMHVCLCVCVISPTPILATHAMSIKNKRHHTVKFIPGLA